MEKLALQKEIIHGFSTKKFGDMRIKKILEENNNLDKFLKVLNLKKSNLIMMEQVHGSKIKEVGKKEVGSVIKGVDGLVTDQIGVVLGVKVADCLPVLFYDYQKKVIGVVHAGWKGILAEIGQAMVKKMRSIGSQPENIFVGIGPHIGGCCYIIEDERAKRFVKKFGNLPKMIIKDNQGIHLDLTVPLKVQLIKAGILKQNIDSPLICTSCKNDEFYSYRKDNNKTYGEILGVISLAN